MSKTRTLRTASIGAIALTLTRQHGFDPDVAHLAAYAWRYGKSSPSTWAQAITSMQRAKQIEITREQAAEIHRAYVRVKIGAWAVEEARP